MDFESLYEKYAPVVRRFALFLSGDAMMADDITSDTFVRALGAHERIRELTVKSYLLMIARNVYRDLQRREWRKMKLDEHKADAKISAQAHMEQKEEVKAVLAALQTLSEIDRTILLMRALDEMPYEEIAAALDIEVTTAKVKVHRARAKLMEVRNPAREKLAASGEKL
ncbi:MAG TPA: sigma-70 family RNA polymerase sigma factor [Candidatus Acidoferrales bacterium]|nr:sigma-70 family RNA polymerase sigma factor [Candidatus Acidoferrales bacterium]